MAARTLLILAAAAVLAVGAAACEGPPIVQGQYGPYTVKNKLLRLPDDDTFTVYRVKYWRFTDGSLPALQLEYAPRGPLTDTMLLRLEVRHIWPSFAPYVEAMGVQTSILTATDLEMRRKGIGWISRTDHFGLVAHRAPDGRWYLAGPPGPPLPPADPGAPPIVEADGQPLTPEQMRREFASQPPDAGAAPAK